MFIFLNIAVVILNVVLFVFLLRSKLVSKSNIGFAGLLISITFWIVISTLENIYIDPFVSLLLVRLDFMFGVIIVFFFFFFAIHFPRNSLQIPRYVSITAALVCSAFFLLGADSHVVASVQVITGGLTIKEGPLFLFYAICLAVFAFTGCIILFIKLKKAKGLEKNRLLFVTIGLVSLTLIVLSCSLILPRVFNPLISNYSIFGFALFIISNFYAVIKFRLLNIRLVITRSLIYFCLILIISLLYVATSTLLVDYLKLLGVENYITWLIFSIVIVLGMDPLKNIFASITDRIFFKSNIDYSLAIKKLSTTISDEINLHDLVSKFLHQLQRQIKLKKTELYILDNHRYIKYDAFLENKEYIKDDFLSKQLEEYLEGSKKILITEEFDSYIYNLSNNVVKAKLKILLDVLIEDEVGAIVPVVRGQKMTAIIFLGLKQSSDSFYDQDVSLLSILASQFSSALERAKLYQEVQDFNYKLTDEVKKATKDLKIANEHLKDLDVAKSEFMSIASHQLRTPLAGMMGYLSMMLSGDYGRITKSQTEVLSEMFTAGQRLTRLVNSFLNATRIEAGRLAINYSNVPFDELIHSVVVELLPTAQKKQVTLTYNRSKLPTVEVDPDKIKDVVLNLIDNAIKYSPGGTITISAKMSEKGMIRFTSQDTGVGIPKGEDKALFDKFVRGSGIARVEPNGSGLGLFIAKKIIEAHGGKIWAESEGEGKGSVFQFEIPTKKIAATKTTSRKLSTLAPATTDTPTRIRKKDRPIKQVSKKTAKTKQEKR